MSFIQEFLYEFKKDLKKYLVYSKFATAQIYYKSEIYACTNLQLPAIVFASKSIGEVVLKCKGYSFALGLDFLIYTHCRNNSVLGFEIATLIVNFLVSKYYLQSFSIDDSQIVDEGSQDMTMVTIIRSSLGMRINSGDLGLAFVNKEKI
ncbi:hypothetical protein CNO09_05925 (plasmid) [Borrelia miyamotoi]|uniref:Uncharacterized protein n=2 Tax=Borrelia miyamotoi TaxID=47466 RepID=A0AAQ3CPQ3_9SPIR|nr:hypothetical protein [Borrelia miyamotoi]ATQ17896.1 hypothetical protein CNO12_06300 [Borrelia miyamotoi]ATQ20384.1 hypothetical protein CNO10_06290 [Borrelia miyamotoi]ATQ21595.1 hypothetical protein CNO09_05925 [Borrelia miyamotoi]QBK62557.1 hypothetical protein EZU67_05235 [Borrelia miyamotoi]QBK63981.1 hypothetical protein EZU68_06295 [Borrelia miyamotoi]